MKVSAFIKEDPIPPIPKINLQHVKSSNTFFKREMDTSRLVYRHRLQMSEKFATSLSEIEG
jgi:hypothetical protein